MLAIVALLLTLAMPRYFQSIDTAKEVVLTENLHTAREAIDKFYGDTGRYPNSLDELVARKYLRALPMDPISSSPWLVIPPDSNDAGAVFDIKSTSLGKTRDGKLFTDL